MKLARIIHGLIYYETKLPTILAFARRSILIVSGDTTPRLIPAEAQA